LSAVLTDPSTQGYRSALCALAGVPRATAYRDRRGQAAVSQARQELVSQIESVAADWAYYGYRRVTVELGRRGVRVGWRRVLGIMREKNLLCRRRKRFVATTDSAHAQRVYPNLKPSISLVRVGQLWVADMTYIRVPKGFVYLAVVLDAYSRKAVGWAISERIDTKLALSALSMGLAKRGAPMYHHSDRGSQYASAEYVAELSGHQVQMSMSRTGNPYDNAGMESFMKTLKYEEVNRAEYKTMADAWGSIDHFIGTVYNDKRLHSALGYVPPTEFENEQQR
jgi:putative transposase